MKKWLVWATLDRYTWNLAEGSANIQTLNGHTNSVRALSTLSNGNIASGSGDKTIKIWNVSTGECIHTLNGHTSCVYALTTLSDGKIGSGSDNTIKIW